jgi:hypothetical protein
MLKQCTRPGVALLAATTSLALAPSAIAKTAVFGGNTRAGDPIVLTTDAKAKKLRGIVIAWDALCGDGTYFGTANALTPIHHPPGATPDVHDLVTSRNAKGRFAGSQLIAFNMGNGSVAHATIDVRGKLRPRRATGTLSATVEILDATANSVGTCRSGTVKWTATHAPGRLYGGRTAQEEPVVVRVDKRRKRVNEMRIGWESASCQPPGYMRIGEQFANFSVRGGAFGDSFTQEYPADGGGQFTYSYALKGSVARRLSRGTLSVQVKQTDAAGAVVATCDSGSVSWQAKTS